MPLNQRSITEDKMNEKKAHQERVQKKTFTNWLNTYLCTSENPTKINDLFLDIRDGLALIRVLEILGKQKLPTEVRPRMQRVHCLANIKMALDFLTSKKVKLVNINPADIVDGKPAIVLGLIWSIILYFQIEEQEKILMDLLGLPMGTRSQMSAKQILKRWVQEIFEGKYHVQVTDFGQSWRDGRAFNAMVHNINPTLVKMEEVDRRSHRENLEHAFTQAETHLGIPKLLDPEDVDVEKPDEKSIMTYVAQFFKAYPEVGRKKSPEISSFSKELEDLIIKMQAAELTINKFRGEKDIPLSEQFSAYRAMRNELETINQCLVKLWTQPSNSASNTEMEFVEERWKRLQDSAEDWKWWIDSLIPGELSSLAEWLTRTEKWFKRTSLHWCQRKGRNGQLGMSGMENESWGPNSADPPNSPTSLNTLESLLNEKNELFGVNSMKATSMRDAVLSASRTGNHPLTKEIVEHMSKRISDAISKEPGFAASLECSKARRQFLDVLFATQIEETEETIHLSRRRSSLTAGFERSFANWNAIIENKSALESEEQLRQYIEEYQNSIEHSKLPGKLDQFKEDLRKQFSLVEKLHKLDTNLVPENAVSIIEHWIQNCNGRWNETREQELQQVGTQLQRIWNEWEVLQENCGKIETWLSRAESMVENSTDLPTDVMDVHQWLSEAEVTAKSFVKFPENDKLVRYRNRLQHLEEQVEQNRKNEAKKAELTRQQERSKIESEMMEKLKVTEQWIAEAQRCAEHDLSPRGSPNKASMKANMQAVQGKIRSLTERQDEVKENLQRTIHLANTSSAAISFIERLNRAEADFTSWISKIALWNMECDEITEKVGQIEKALERVRVTTERSRAWIEKVPLKDDRNHKDMQNELAESRALLNTTRSLIDHLEHALNCREIAKIYGLNTSQFSDSLDKLEQAHKKTESIISNAIDQFEQCIHSLDELKRDLDELEADLHKSERSSNEFRSQDMDKIVVEYDSLNKRHVNLTEAFRKIKDEVEQVIGTSTDREYRASPEVVVAIVKKFESLKKRKDKFDKAMEQFQTETQLLQKKLSALKDSIGKASEWVAAQERRFGILNSGPTAAALSHNTDKMNLRGKRQLYKQWMEECRNFSNTLEKESAPYASILSKKSADGSISPQLQRECEELRQRYQSLETSVKSTSTESEKILKAAETLSECLNNAQDWLEHTQSAFLAIVDLEEATDTPVSEENLRSRKDELSDLQDSMRVGEANLSKVTRAHKQLDEVGKHQRAAQSMLVSADEETGEFQEEYKKLQSRIKVTLDQTEQALTHHEKLVAAVKLEEDWLNQWKNRLHDKPQIHFRQYDEEKSLSEFDTITKFALDQCRKSLQELESHKSQALNKLVKDLEVEGDSAIQSKGRQLQSEYEKHLREASKVNDNWTEFDNVLKTTKEKVNELTTWLNDLDRKRLDVLKVTDCQRAESVEKILECIEETREKLEILSSRRSEADDQFAVLKLDFKDLKEMPSELRKIRQKMDDLSSNFEQDLKRLDHIEDEMRSFSASLSECDNVLERVRDYADHAFTVSFNLNNLDSLVRYVEKSSRSFTESLQDLGLTLTQDGDSTFKNVKAFTEMKNCYEKVTSIDRHLTVPLKHLYKIKMKHIENMESLVKERLSQFRKTRECLTQIVTSAQECQEFLDNIEKLYNDSSRRDMAESLGVVIKSSRDLLNKLKSNGPCMSTNLKNQIDQGILCLSKIFSHSDMRRIEEILATILNSFNNRLDDLKSELSRSVNETVELADTEKGFEHELKAIRHDLKQIKSFVDEIGTKLSQGVIAVEQLDIDVELQNETIKLESQTNRIERIRRALDETSYMSPNLRASLEQVEDHISEIYNSLEHCRKLCADHKSASTRYKIAWEQCLKLWEKRKYRIDQTLLQPEELSATTRPGVEHSRIMKKLEELDQFSQEIHLAQDIFNQKQTGGPHSTAKSSFLAAVEELLRVVELCGERGDSLEWINLEKEMNAELAKIDQARDELLFLNDRLTEWETAVNGLEEFIKKLEGQLRERSLTDLIKGPGLDIKDGLNLFAEEIQSIQDVKLPQMRSDLVHVTQLTNRLLAIKRVETGNDRPIVDRLNRIRESCDRIEAMFTQALKKYERLTVQSDQINTAIEETLKWMQRFNSQVTELEKYIPGEFSTGSEDSPSQLWISTAMQKLKQLEKQRSDGELKVKELLERINLIDHDGSRSYSQKLTQSLDELSPQRLGRVSDAFMKLQQRMKEFETLEKHAKRKVKEFTDRINRIKEESRRMSPVRYDQAHEDYKRAEKLWISLSGEIDKEIDTTLNTFFNLGSSLSSSKAEYSPEQFQEDLFRLRAEVEEQLNATIKHDSQSARTYQSIQQFEKAVLNARKQFSHVTNGLRMKHSDNTMTTPEPSIMCGLLLKSVEWTQNMIDRFQKEVLERLKDTYQQLAQQFEHDEEWEQHDALRKYEELLQEVMISQVELDNCHTTCKDLCTSWHEQEEILAKLVADREKSFSEEFLTGNVLLDVLPCVNGAKISDPQLEVTRNMQKLTELLNSVQDPLNKSTENRNLLEAGITSVDKLSANSESLADHISSLIFVEEQCKYEIHKPRMSPRFNEFSIVTQSIVSFRRRQDDLLKHLQQDIENKRTRLEIIRRLIHAVKELDSWNTEFRAQLEKLDLKRNELTTNNKALLDWQLSNGKSLVQSIRDWVSHFHNTKMDDYIISAARHQLSRGECILHDAKVAYEDRVLAVEEQVNARKMACKNQEEIRSLIDRCEKTVKEMKRQVVGYFSVADRMDSIRARDADLGKMMEKLGDLALEIEGMKNLVAQRGPVWIEQGVVPATEVRELQHAIGEQEIQVEQFVNNLKTIRNQIRETDQKLHSATQWVQGIGEQIFRTREGRSPIRFARYVGIEEKVGEDVVQFQKTTANETSRDTFSSASEKYREREEQMSQLSTEVETTGRKVLQDMNTLVDRLKTSVSEFDTTASLAILQGEVEELRSAIEHLEYMLKQGSHDVRSKLRMLDTFEKLEQEWHAWLNDLGTKLKNAYRTSVVGFQDDLFGTDQRQLASNITLDVVRPVGECLRKYQELQKEVMLWKSKFSKLQRLSTDLEERCQTESLKHRIKQIIGQYDAMEKGIPDVTTKLHLLCSEEGRFFNHLTDLKSWLTQNSLEIPKNLEDPSAELDDWYEKAKEWSKKLEQENPKLIELSDKADRVYLATCTAALAMNNLLNTLPGADEESRIPSVLIHRHCSQPVPNVVGLRVKQELEDLKESWLTISQSIAKSLELLKLRTKQQTKLQDQYDQLKEWLDISEDKLNQLETNVATLDADRSTALHVYTGEQTDEAQWRANVLEYQSLLGDINEKRSDFQRLKNASPPKSPNGQTDQYDRLFERYERLRSKVEERTSWCLRVQNKLDQFNYSVREAEHLISRYNIKMITPDLPSEGENSASTSKQLISKHDGIISGLESEVAVAIRNVHELVHTLVHCVVDRRPRSVCDSMQCNLRTHPFSANTFNTVQSMVRSSGNSLGHLVIDAVRRTMELEKSYENLFTSAKAFKNQFTSKIKRWKDYVSLLHEAAVFLTKDMPERWAELTRSQEQRSSQPTRRFQTTEATASVNRLHEQLHQLQSTSGPYTEPKLVASSLEDLESKRQFAQATELELNKLKINLIAAEDRLAFALSGDTSMELLFNENGADVELIRQMENAVQRTIDREISKLQQLTKSISELKVIWEDYIKERTTFRQWLNDRKMASENLYELRSHSLKPNDREVRALEDFLQSLRSREERMQILKNKHRTLAEHNQAFTDLEFNQIKADYEILLTRTEARFQQTRGERKQSHPAKNGGAHDNLGSLVQASGSSLKHTRALNQLARSVRKINEELSVQETNGYSRREPICPPPTRLGYHPRASESIRLDCSWTAELEPIRMIRGSYDAVKLLVNMEEPVEEECCKDTDTVYLNRTFTEPIPAFHVINYSTSSRSYPSLPRVPSTELDPCVPSRPHSISRSMTVYNQTDPRSSRLKPGLCAEQIYFFPVKRYC